MLVGALAEMISVSVPTMSRIETGAQEPSAHQVALVARALGVRVGALYGDPPADDVVEAVVAAALSGSTEAVRARLTEAVAALTRSVPKARP